MLKKIITYVLVSFFLAGSANVAMAQNKKPSNPPTQKESEAARAEALRNKRKITVEKPDLKDIKEKTLNPKSPYYFPNLMKQYHRNDTNMTNDQYRYFYLGYMFQEDYDPYRKSPFVEITDELRDNFTGSKAELDSLIKYTELSLNDNPFDLRQMSLLVNVLKQRKKDMSARIWEYRLEHLLGAIKSTGTGEDTDNAWYVIYPVHEYDLIGLLGYHAVDADFIEPGFDYLTVQPDPDSKIRGKAAKGFYFNVDIPTEQYVNKHPELWEEDMEE